MANAQKMKTANGQEYEKLMKVGSELTVKLKQLNKEAGV